MKYIKPRSVTWWASMVPLSAGLILASEPIHGFFTLVEVIQNMTDLRSAELITAGVGGIGMRAAIK